MLISEKTTKILQAQRLCYAWGQAKGESPEKLAAAELIIEARTADFEAIANKMIDEVSSGSPITKPVSKAIKLNSCNIPVIGGLLSFFQLNFGLSGDGARSRSSLLRKGFEPIAKKLNEAGISGYVEVDTVNYDHAAIKIAFLPQEHAAFKIM